MNIDSKMQNIAKLEFPSNRKVNVELRVTQRLTDFGSLMRSYNNQLA